MPALDAATRLECLSPDAFERIGERLSFSDRERQVARRVFEDKKERLIASELGISAHTVHTHLERIYRKLGVSGRVPLVKAMLGTLMEMTAEEHSIAMRPTMIDVQRRIPAAADSTATEAISTTPYQRLPVC